MINTHGKVADLPGRCSPHGHLPGLSEPLEPAPLCSPPTRGCPGADVQERPRGLHSAGLRNARRAAGLALGPMGSTIPTDAELKVVPVPSFTVGGRREGATCRIAPQPAPLSLASSLEELTRQHITSVALSSICPELGMCGRCPLCLPALGIVPILSKMWQWRGRGAGNSLV